MPALPLAEAIEQAQEAIRGGDYRSAVQTCRAVLEQYPEYVTAHRLLGAADLEQPSRDEAEQAFLSTLARDPQNVAALSGMGLLAEERNDPETALSYFQAAWETAPMRSDLRDAVIRLAQRVYGADGRL